MKDFIMLWIVWQLIIIGIGSASIHNEVVRGVYDCEETELPEIAGAIVPLVFFLPENNLIINYCHDKN